MANVCQVMRAEADANNAVAERMEIDGIVGLIAHTHFERMADSLSSLRKQVEGRPPQGDPPPNGG